MLIDLALKSTVLLAMGFVLARLLRHASAASRHTVWTTVFVAMLLLPAARVAMPAWTMVVVPERFAYLGASQGATSADVIHASSDVEVSADSVQRPSALQAAWSTPGAGVLVAWMTGVLVCLVWIVAGFVGTRRLEREARQVQDHRVRERALRAASMLGVRRPVRLLAVSNDVMPSTWGVVAPRVLLPEEAREWSDARLDAVLTHELSHVVRGDAASHLSARLATALWWWHPLVWVAAWQARFERERACDDLVLTQGTCATEYATDLVTFVTSLRVSGAGSPASLAMARRSQLEGRVMAILKSDVNRRGVSQAGFLSALLILVLVWPLAAARPEARVQEQQPIRVGGNIQAPTKIKDVRPIYPAAAMAEGRQGVAIIEAVIGANGRVSDATVIRSIGNDLDQAALDAVLQWAFTPTVLNGVPVPIIMTVTVNFSLSNGAPAPPPPPPPPVEPPAVGAPPPPPPPAPPAPPANWASVDGKEPLRIGGNIKPPTKLKDVRPVYPQEARDANVTGIVILEALIDAEGNVADARILRNVALLDEAARDAVMQWKFEPTLLNGVAVPVIMTVTVNFTLQ